ncbi:MAG: hypothetical protein JWM73_2332, partial [Solirubrobacterales bacterium]|nr:hypothetical protein [Solirubrobacterales bacterium]
MDATALEHRWVGVGRSCLADPAHAAIEVVHGACGGRAPALL